MSRGARQLTKKEKDRIKLNALIDAHRWQLTGTLCPIRKPVAGDELKRRLDDNPFAVSKFLHGRWIIVVNANIWAEQVIYNDDEPEAA